MDAAPSPTLSLLHEDPDVNPFGKEQQNDSVVRKNSSEEVNEKQERDSTGEGRSDTSPHIPVYSIDESDESDLPKVTSGEEKKEKKEEKRKKK
ncbi:hypothetical protein PFISCL1PPCAC_1611, partial [Pristionchus fissidentatus]